MDKNVDIKKISSQIFPNHTELGAYNQLAGKIGRRPLNQKEYDELKRTKRRPDSKINSENKTRNMAKNIIRLTESDLHRIVKESVERILRESVNEVELGGESLHGDNAEDWFAVSNLRDRNAKRDKKLATSKFYKNNNDAMNSYFNNTIEGGKDWRNGTNLAKQGLGKALDGGRDKSNRIIKNLDPRDF